LLGEDFLLFLDLLATLFKGSEFFIETRNLLIDCGYLLFDSTASGLGLRRRDVRSKMTYG
jgi:hypothetical protein